MVIEFEAKKQNDADEAPQRNPALIVAPQTHHHVELKQPYRQGFAQELINQRIHAGRSDKQLLLHVVDQAQRL